MTKVVVLGANSFAGGCLVAHLLQRGFTVIGINRSAESAACMTPYKLQGLNKNYRFYQLDINKHLDDIIGIIETAKPHFFVDLAGQGMVAESWQAPHQWYQTNLVTKSKLIQALCNKSWLKKYIRISTPEVYGSTENLIKESREYAPSTPYAVSHAAIDMHLYSLFRQYDFPVVLGRFSNFYGPTQQLYRIIPRTILYAKTKHTLTLHGGGKAIRAFIHGEDVASAILAMMEKADSGEIFHFSTDTFISIRDLVARICQQTGTDFDELVTVGEERPGKDLQYLMDDSKARDLLGWKARINLEQGIEQTAQWMEQNWQAIQQEPREYIHKE